MRLPKTLQPWVVKYVQHLQQKSKSPDISWEELLVRLQDESEWKQFYETNYEPPKPREKKNKKDGEGEKKGARHDDDGSSVEMSCLAGPGIDGPPPAYSGGSAESIQIRRKLRRRAERHYVPLKSKLSHDRQLSAHLAGLHKLADILVETVSDQQARIVQAMLFENDVSTTYHDCWHPGLADSKKDPPLSCLPEEELLFEFRAPRTKSSSSSSSVPKKDDADDGDGGDDGDGDGGDDGDGDGGDDSDEKEDESNDSLVEGL